MTWRFIQKYRYLVGYVVGFVDCPTLRVLAQVCSKFHGNRMVIVDLYKDCDRVITAKGDIDFKFECGKRVSRLGFE